MSTKTEEIIDFLASPESEGMRNVDIAKKLGVHDGTVSRARKAMSESSAFAIGDDVDLGQCEAVIERGFKAFVDVGTALFRIRDARLYRDTHETFEDYCRDRWGMARSRAYQLIGAAEVVGNVHNCGQALPATESQARPLAGLEPEQQREAWTQAVETAPNGTPTAKHVAAVVEKMPAVRDLKIRDYAAPAVIEALKNNEISKEQAYRLSFIPRKEQVKVLAGGTDAVKAKAKKIKEDNEIGPRDPENAPDDSVGAEDEYKTWWVAYESSVRKTFKELPEDWRASFGMDLITLAEELFRSCPGTRFERNVPLDGWDEAAREMARSLASS